MAQQGALELVGGSVEVLASGLAASPGGRPGPQLVGIAVVVERKPDKADRARGQQHRSEPTFRHQAREALR